MFFRFPARPIPFCSPFCFFLAKRETVFFRVPAFPSPVAFLLAKRRSGFSASLSALAHSALICSLIERVSFEAGRGVVCPSAEEALASKKTNSTIFFKLPICGSTVATFRPGRLVIMRCSIPLEKAGAL